jgi:hypothetical protein
MVPNEKNVIAFMPFVLKNNRSDAFEKHHHTKSIKSFA